VKLNDCGEPKLPSKPPLSEEDERLPQSAKKMRKNNYAARRKAGVKKKYLDKNIENFRGYR
jgi:hypothetical protein